MCKGGSDCVRKSESMGCVTCRCGISECVTVC